MNDSIEKEDSVIEYILEKEGIVLPKSFLKKGLLKEIEKSIVSPHKMENLMRKIAKNIEEYLPQEDLEKFISAIHKYDELTLQYSLSDEDLLIIDFLVKQTKTDERYVLEMMGPFYFLQRISDNIQHEVNISRILVVTALLYTMVSSYELLLYMIDRRIYYYLKYGEGKKDRTLQKNDKIKRFLKVDRSEYMSHAEAGKIKGTLSEILEKDLNNSIIGSKSHVKILRNKISHINLFYDDQEDLVFVGVRKYTYDDLLEAFFIIFRFFIEWGKKSINVEEHSDMDKYIRNLQNGIKDMFYRFARAFKRIERSGEIKSRYQSVVMIWKKEAKES